MKRLKAGVDSMSKLANLRTHTQYNRAENISMCSARSRGTRPDCQGMAAEKVTVKVGFCRCQCWESVMARLCVCLGDVVVVCAGRAEGAEGAGVGGVVGAGAEGVDQEQAASLELPQTSPRSPWYAT